MTLEERVISWREAAVQEGVEQGLREGREQGLRLGVEQGIRQSVEQAIRPGMEQGIRQGLEQIRQQSIERERVLLRRLAETRFDAPTAERLFALLAREDNPQRLDAIGVAIVRCETGDELLQQARQPDLPPNMRVSTPNE